VHGCGYRPAGGRGASDEEVEAAARACFVDHIIKALPQGYDTVLEEDAANISAGERQLLTIARAFVANPAVLILDEATSSVDTRTELLVQQAMNALREGRDPWLIMVTFVQSAEERQARWSLDLTARAVHALDDEARWLTEAGAGAKRPAVFDQDSKAPGASASAPSAPVRGAPGVPQPGGAAQHAADW